MRIYEYDPIMVSHAFAKLGGNRHRGTGDFSLSHNLARPRDQRVE